MIAIVYTEIDATKNPVFEELFLREYQKAIPNVKFIVSEEYGKLIKDEGSDKVTVIKRNEQLDENIISVFKQLKCDIVLLHQENTVVTEYLSKNNIETYFKNDDSYFNKYYRLKQQKEEIQNQLTECQNYINSLSIHATKLDDELKKYKAMYDNEDNMVEEMKRVEKQKTEYLDLYRGLLDKLDQLTVENLNLKKQKR